MEKLYNSLAPDGGEGRGEGNFRLVAMLHLGTLMDAKLSLAHKYIPKQSLGTRRT
jgi:hypothetical protein